MELKLAKSTPALEKTLELACESAKRDAEKGVAMLSDEFVQSMVDQRQKFTEALEQKMEAELQLNLTKREQELATNDMITLVRLFWKSVKAQQEMLAWKALIKCSIKFLSQVPSMHRWRCGSSMPRTSSKATPAPQN